VACLAPQCHTAKTPDQKKRKYYNVACLQSLYDVELQQIFFLVKQSGAEEFSGGAHIKEYGVALPPACLLSGSDHYYSQIFTINWQDWQNCILSP